MKSEKINFVPGFPEQPSEHENLSNYFNVLRVDWNNPQLKFKKKPDILVGFSYGGVLVLEYALKRKVKIIILCSLTPSIETLEKVKAGHVIFLVGEKEKWCLKNIKRVAGTLKCRKSIIIIPGAVHKITGNYRAKLIEVVSDVGQ